MLRVPYTDETYENLVVEYEAQGYTLVEVQDLTEGNFLIFGKKRITPERRLEAMENALLAMMFRGGGDV